MSDKQYWLITVRFPAWSEGDHKYPAFGIRYLIQTPNIQIPDWPEDDERWASFSEEADIKRYFLEDYKRNSFGSSREFNGEILFVEAFEITPLLEGK